MATGLLPLLNSELAAFFNTGDQPSETEFAKLIDTIVPNPVALADSSTATLTKAANQGRVNVVPDQSQTSTYTIPTPAAAGEWYNFVYVGGAAEAHNHAFALGTSGAVFYVGNVAWINQNDTSDDGTSIWSDGDSNELLTLVTPESYNINILSKSTTEWYLWGWVSSVSIPTIAD